MAVPLTHMCAHSCRAVYYYYFVKKETYKEEVSRGRIKASDKDIYTLASLFREFKFYLPKLKYWMSNNNRVNKNITVKVFFANA